MGPKMDLQYLKYQSKITVLHFFPQNLGPYKKSIGIEYKLRTCLSILQSLVRLGTILVKLLMTNIHEVDKV